MYIVDLLVLLGYKQIYMDIFYFLTLYIFYDTQSIENGLRFAQINFKYGIKTKEKTETKQYSVKIKVERKGTIWMMHKNVWDNWANYYATNMRSRWVLCYNILSTPHRWFQFHLDPTTTTRKHLWEVEQQRQVELQVFVVHKFNGNFSWLAKTVSIKSNVTCMLCS